MAEPPDTFCSIHNDLLFKVDEDAEKKFLRRARLVLRTENKEYSARMRTRWNKMKLSRMK